MVPGANSTATASSGIGSLDRAAPTTMTGLYAVAIAAMLLATLSVSTSSSSGRRALLRAYRFLDHLCGGAPYNVDLPGPVGLPLFGSLGEVLKHGHCQMLKVWRQTYGEVVRVSLGSREAVFINSYAALAETIVQQGAAYQSRPVFKLFHKDFASNGVWTIGTSPMGPSLQRVRKAFNGQLAPRFLPAYARFTHARLQRLMRLLQEASRSGEALDMADPLHRYGSGQVTELLLGTHINEDDVGLVTENETDIFRLRTVGFPQRDYVPALALWERMVYLVKKMALRDSGPGADPFESRAKGMRSTQAGYMQRFISELKRRVQLGDETPSILGNILRAGSHATKDALKDREFRSGFYTGIAAGVNLGYALSWTIIYLANRPDLQEEAHAAICQVYGGADGAAKCPDPHDFNRVPYIQALYLEGSRMYTPVRLGFPREALDGATFRGKEIPKGTLVLMNLLGCNHDPEVFDRPDEFLPERWLDGHKGNTKVKGPVGARVGSLHLMYGAGRRMCPGIELANNSMYALLVLFLHFFKWERAPLSERAKADVFPLFRAERECSLDVDPLLDVATPSEAQAIPWSAGIKWTCRDAEGLEDFCSADLESEGTA